MDCVEDKGIIIKGHKSCFSIICDLQLWLWFFRCILDVLLLLSLIDYFTGICSELIVCGIYPGSTLFQDPIFRNNLAGRNGGGMSIENAVSEVFLQHVTATGNTALRGGGIYVDSVPHFRISGGRRGTVESVNKFKKNKASVGGGLYVSAENRQSNTILVCVYHQLFFHCVWSNEY